MRKFYTVPVLLVLLASMILSACAAPTPQVVEKVVEKPVVQTQVVEKQVVQTQVVKEVQTQVVEKQVVVTATPEPAKAPEAGTLPRTETLYFNGQQWSAVVGWNPYSNSNNNAMAVAQQDNARVSMFETPYLYNMLDGQQYPLLADGDYAWNAARTEITFKIKPAAKWSDGAPVTAEDVAYTWATAAKYGTPLFESTRSLSKLSKPRMPRRSW